jgi:predicted DNA-binding transcriptional regulator AlpA
MKLLDAEAVANKLGVPITWVYERTRERTPVEKRIPHIRLGKYRKFVESVIDQWIANGCKPLPPGAHAQ